MAEKRLSVTLARVSSKAQEEGYSLDSQQKLLRKYCKEQRLNINKEFRISETASKNEQRTIFKEMLLYIKKNGITDLIVEKTDRLTRNLRDAVIVDDWLEINEKRRLHMVKEGLIIHKKSRSDERLMWNIYLAISRKQIDNLREEAMKGWAEKLAQGWMPSSPPLGYKTVIDSGKKIHVIDEDKAALIERAFRLYLEVNQNIDTVTDEVTKHGLVTKSGRPLCRTAIHKILDNPFYCGTIRFDGKLYPGAHEPLINRDIFDKVQEKLHGKHHTHQITHNPVFKGLLRCSVCDATVTWQLQKGRYYGACQRWNDICKGRRLLREDRLEEQLLNELDQIDTSPSGNILLRKLIKFLEDRHHPYIGKHRLSVIKMIQQRIRRLERIEDNLYEDQLSGLVNEKKYIEMSNSLHVELTVLRKRLTLLENHDSTSLNEDKPTTLHELFIRASKNDKQKIIHELFTMTYQFNYVEFTLKKISASRVVGV